MFITELLEKGWTKEYIGKKEKLPNHSFGKSIDPNENVQETNLYMLTPPLDHPLKRKGTKYFSIHMDNTAEYLVPEWAIAPSSRA